MKSNSQSKQASNTSKESHSSAQERQEEMIINQIIKSSSQPQSKKIEKLKDIQQQFMNVKDVELKKIFNIKSLSVIQAQLNDVQTELFQDLLNIIEFITDRGSEMQLVFDNQAFSYKTPFFNNMKISGLISKLELIIGKMINVKIDLQDNQKISNSFQQIKSKLKQVFSSKQKEIIIGQLSPEHLEQIISVYLLIMIGQKIDKNILKKFIIIINNNLDEIMNLFQEETLESEQKEKNNNRNKIQTKIQHFEKLIQSLIKTKQYNRDNNEFLNSEMIVEKILSQIIHINCPIDLNCQQNISLNQTPQLIQFLELVYNIIGQILQNYRQTKQFLIKKHNILLHIVPFILNYNQLLSIQQQQIKNESQFLFQSPILIVHVLKVLYELLEFNQSNVNQISDIPSLIKTLVNLSLYKVDYHQSKDKNKIAFRIRNNCGACLNQILEFANETSIIQLSNSGYINSLINICASCGDYREGNVTAIISSLSNIHKFFSLIIFGKEMEPEPDCVSSISESYCEQPLFPNQPLCIKQSLEQIEESGGNEEIESYLVNNRGSFDEINQYAYKAKIIISNSSYL